MYGETDYLAIGCVFRRSEAVTDLSLITPAIDVGIGLIAPNGPPAQIIKIPDMPSRNWIYLEPQIVSHSKTYQVTRSWLLSGPGGANSLIYGMSAATLSAGL